MADELEELYPGEFKYKQFRLNDSRSDDITQFFLDALLFLGKEFPITLSNSVESARKEGKRVLVHCAMGISRSPAIVIAWLMKDNVWDFEKAKNFVKTYRSCIKPNEGFVTQLKSFEEYLKSSAKKE
jgi:protein phosphatase slingshot